MPQNTWDRVRNSMDGNAADAPENDGILFGRRNAALDKAASGQMLTETERRLAGVSEHEEAAVRARGPVWP